MVEIQRQFWHMKLLQLHVIILKTGLLNGSNDHGDGKQHGGGK